MTTTNKTRWIDGVGLVLGPVLLLAGVLARVDVNDFFPDQLAAYAVQPGQMVLSYSLFAAGVVALCPAVIALARRIGVSQPGWAVWGATLVVLGLFGRVFHLGISHLAFQMVDALGVQVATKAVSDTYGAFHVFKAVNVFIMVGWIVLAIGAYRAKALGVIQSVALALAAGLPLGVLKGSSDPISLVAIVGLGVALVPLGVSVLKEGPAPRWWVAALTIALVPVAFFLGLSG